MENIEVEHIRTWLEKSSIIIPAKNEAPGLSKLLPELRKLVKETQILVVDDGSVDDTQKICREYNIQTIRHIHSKGNGAAIKTGARAAKQDIIVLMDADGQHDPKFIPLLLKKIERGADMAVGARDVKSQANMGRMAANRFYNFLASWMVGETVEDLTSGFRAVYRKKFLEFIDLLPNGFSYPTTITISFFRAGYNVAYVPIQAAKRLGKSHLSVKRDGVRFLLIIFKIGTLYSPLKIFFPVSLGLFLTGLFYYIYTYIIWHRFTNMSGLLFTTAIIVFLMGLIAEQINNLQYSLLSKDREK